MLTQQELAQALGVTDRSIRVWRAEGMPTVGDGRAAVYDEGACRAWCLRHGKKTPGRQAPAQTTERPQAPAPQVSAAKPDGRPAGRDLVARVAEAKALRLADATPVERARAALAAASSALADAIESADGAAGRDFDSFRATLDGLRQAEAAYLDLEQERGTLITRDAARATGAMIAQRLVRAFDLLTARLVAQVEMWVGDGAFQALETTERARVVRAWADSQGREVRRAEAADVEALLAAQAVDRATA